MGIFNQFCLCFLILVGSGCAVVGPDIQPPVSPNLSPNYSRTPTVANVVPLESWWQSWADPKLHELVNLANSQNLDTRQAYFRIVEARANVGVARGGLGPNLGLFSEYSYRQTSQNDSSFVVGSTSPFDLFTKGADAAWQIDLFGKIRRTIEAAESRACFAEFDAQSIRQTLLSDTASAYLRIRLLQDQIVLVEQSIRIQEDTQKLVDDRKEAGVSTELDSAQTESFIERSRTLMIVLSQQLELEFNTLSLLLSEVPAQELRDYLNDQSIVQMPPLPEIGFPADLIRNRPDVRREEMAFAATLAEIGVAEADLYPQLSLTGTVGVSATNISNLFRTESLVFAVGPSLRWDIFQSGRIKCNIEAARARCEQAHLKYQQTVLSAVREVEDSLAQYNGFLLQTQTLSKAVTADERAVELSLERYKAGRANFQRALDSQQQLLQDLQQRSSTQFQAIVQVVRLYNSLGGNWGSFCPTNGQGMIVDIPMQAQHINAAGPFDNQNIVSETGLQQSQFPSIIEPTHTIAETPSNISPIPDVSPTTDSAQPETTLDFQHHSLSPISSNGIPDNPVLDFQPVEELEQQWNANEVVQKFDGPLPVIKAGIEPVQGGALATDVSPANPFILKTSSPNPFVNQNRSGQFNAEVVKGLGSEESTTADSNLLNSQHRKADSKSWQPNPNYRN